MGKRGGRGLIRGFTLLKVGAGSSNIHYSLFVCLFVCLFANKQTFGFSDLSSDQNLSLDPLMLLASPVLKPNPDDPGV